MTRTRTRLLAGISGLALLGGLAGCGSLGLGGGDVKTLTASFERTVGLYENSDVRILGVPVGRVVSIEPKGEVVEVVMEYDADYDVPAEAQAVVVAPSIVSDRYVQLTPVHTSGPTLEDGAVLGTDRTAEPVELDDIYASLDELNVALGPDGANQDGALSDLLDVSAKNLDGNGELLGQTLEDFATLVTTVSDQRADLFGTVRNLQDFTTTIANADGTVRSFNRDLAQVADQLEGEREDLARAVKELSVALGEVATFVRENEDLLKTNITDLASVTSVLVKQRTALEEFIDVSPTALSNLQLAYNPSTGTLDTRDNGPAQAEQDPLRLLCSVLNTAGQGAVCDQLRDVLGGLPLPAPPGGGGGLPLPASAPAAAPAPVVRDMTLGGILDGGR